MYTLMQPLALPRRVEPLRLAGPPAPHLLAPYPPLREPSPAEPWPAEECLPDDGMDEAC